MMESDLESDYFKTVSIKIQNILKSNCLPHCVKDCFIKDTIYYQTDLGQAKLVLLCRVTFYTSNNTCGKAKATEKHGKHGDRFISFSPGLMVTRRANYSETEGDYPPRQDNYRCSIFGSEYQGCPLLPLRYVIVQKYA